MDMHAYFSRRLGQCRPRTREETREILVSPEQRSGLYEEASNSNSQTDVTETSAVCNGNLIRPLEPDLIRGRGRLGADGGYNEILSRFPQRSANGRYVTVTVPFYVAEMASV